ncbi:uncharacterized protein J4E87_000301 [Alternaria ethzedia]|uniref:uncharacterized protein n=1 Tax=Alternaria ethzedia TaxID=181014 RepID=UPI0020C2A787|nr:uncharacterized protein J4E87_000301 [Alternaria ethzedia]KAI4635351.1 hypothetical protein J4E87_000301 [Alternaria ethzedia]
MAGNVSRYLQVSPTCFLCNRAFGPDHAPAALRACGHIFGYRCLSIILNGGDVELKSTWPDIPSIGIKGAECPECQVPITNLDSEQRALSILGDISSAIPDHRDKLNAFVEQLRDSVANTDPDVNRQDILHFFKKCYTSDGDDILQKALQDAASAGDYFSPFHDAITASRGASPQPMAFPLIRFCFLLWDAHNAIERKTSLAINILLWEANRCLGVNNPLVQWEDVEEAADLENARLFPLLHGLTMLVSQGLARNGLMDPWPEEKKLDLAQQFACEFIGPHFEGQPSDMWLAKLALVVNELKRHQFEMGRKPLTGVAAEKSIVRGWWAIAHAEVDESD